MTIPSPSVPPTARVRPSRPTRRRAVVLAALVAVLALVGASCKQLDPDNRTLPVPGVTNGDLPLSYLAKVDGCVVYDEAAASLKAMIAAAKADNVVLKGISCYRDYAGQVAARNDWCNKGACQMAAVPGTSNHGWGKAVDFRDANGELTFDSTAYAWLKAWAGFYGWMHPKNMDEGGSVPEPWHWEWIGDGGKMYPGEYFGIGNTPLAEPRGMPFGNLEGVVPGAGGVTVGGWAIDPDQVAPIEVHVYVDQAGTRLIAGDKRPDVGEAFPLFSQAGHGFSSFIPASPGPHQVCVFAINMSGTGSNRLLGCPTVTVPEPAATTAAPTTTVVPTTTTTVPAAAPTTAPSTSSTTTSPVAAQRAAPPAR